MTKFTPSPQTPFVVELSNDFKDNEILGCFYTEEEAKEHWATSGDSEEVLLLQECLYDEDGDLVDYRWIGTRTVDGESEETRVYNLLAEVRAHFGGKYTEQLADVVRDANGHIETCRQCTVRIADHGANWRNEAKNEGPVLSFLFNTDEKAIFANLEIKNEWNCSHMTAEEAIAFINEKINEYAK